MLFVGIRVVPPCARAMPMPMPMPLAMLISITVEGGKGRKP